MTLNMVWARAVRWALTPAPIVASSAVTVVPMFSPRTRAAAPGKLNRPWEAKAMVRPIVAEEDWRRMVRPAPVRTQSRISERFSALNLVMKTTKSG